MLLQLLTTVVHGIMGDRIWVRAGHMTYLALLHLVPLGALGLSLSSRLGWKQLLVHWFEERLSPGAPGLAEGLVAAMDRLDLVAIGYVGLAAVVVAGVFAFSQLEDDFRRIWHSPTRRPWWRRILLYPLTIAVAPMIIAVVLAFGAVAEVRTKSWISSLAQWGDTGRALYHLLTDLPLVFHLIPYVLTWIMLTGVYYLVTSAPVRFRSAAVGGVFAGIAWQVAQRVYLRFQFESPVYKEVWGYLAQVPLLLLWIYVTWIIVYIGAEVVFAWQYRQAFLPKWRFASNVSAETAEHAAIEIVSEIVKAKAAGEDGLTAATISRRCHIPWPLVDRLAHRLAGGNYLARERRASGYVFHASDQLAQLRLSDFLAGFRRLPSGVPDVGDGKMGVRSDATIGEIAGLTAAGPEKGKDGS